MVQILFKMVINQLKMAVEFENQNHHQRELNKLMEKSLLIIRSLLGNMLKKLVFHINHVDANFTNVLDMNKVCSKIVEFSVKITL